MKKLVLTAIAGVLLSGAAPALADETTWYMMTFDDSYAYFVNDDSKVRDGNTVSAWFAHVLVSPKPEYDMMMVAWSADCKKRTIDVEDIGHYLKGDPVGPRFQKRGEPRRVRPGTIAEAFYKTLCKKTDKTFPFEPRSLDELSKFGRFIVEEIKRNPPK